MKTIKITLFGVIAMFQATMAQVSLNITQNWGTGYQGIVSIAPTEDIMDWEVVLNLPSGNLENSWNGNFAVSGNTITITPQAQNAMILAGQTVQDIGFVVQNSNSLATLSGFTLTPVAIGGGSDTWITDNSDNVYLNTSLSGMVGIGTTTPSSALEIAGDEQRVTLDAEGSPAGSTGIVFQANGNDRYEVEYNFFPSFGSNLLHLRSSTSGHGIHIGNSSTWFGNGPIAGAASNDFNFTGTSRMSNLVVGNFGPCGGCETDLPAGYRMAVGGAIHAEGMQIAGQSQRLTMNAIGTLSGNTGINFQANGADRYRIYYSYFPSFGSNVLHINNTTSGNGIHIGSSGVWVGNGPSAGAVSNEFNVVGTARVSNLVVGNFGPCGGCETDLPAGYRMAVDGPIACEEVLIQNSTNWPDYVFEEAYDLASLQDLETYITTNKHLPEVPSEKEINEKGIESGKMDAVLLKKIEELTLYIIEQNKKIETIEAQLKSSPLSTQSSK